MFEAALQLCRAGRVFASPDSLVRGPMQRAAAPRADGRHHPVLRTLWTLAQDWSDDPRDDVTRLLDDDPVAFTDVLARDVVGVVQRRHRDSRTGDKDRLQHRKWRDGPGAPDVHLDALEKCGLLLGREFERDRPARELAGR